MGKVGMKVMVDIQVEETVMVVEEVEMQEEERRFTMLQRERESPAMRCLGQGFSEILIVLEFAL